jgi:hypothetical protein
MIVLVLVCTPPPQVAVHALHALHALTTQSTGQGWVLQGCVSVRIGQGAPPLAAGVITVLVLVITPPPQVAVHALHALQALTTQSTGQGWVLQGCVSVRIGQGAPPNMAGVITVLVLVITPPPQVAVHALHALHALTTQSTGQGWVLQGCVSVRIGQGAPPLAAGVITVLVLVRMPPPQDAVQSLHRLQSLTTQSTGQGCSLQGIVSESIGQGVPP